MRNLLRRRSSKEATRQQPAGGLATAARATQAAQKLKHPLKLELMRVDVRQIKNIDQIAQTFNARVFIQFRIDGGALDEACLLYTSPSPRDKRQSRMPSSA